MLGLTTKLSTLSLKSTRIELMSNVNNIDIHTLSQSERIMLAEKLWDSVAENQDYLEVTSAQRKVLEARLAVYEASPNEGHSWEDVKKEMK